MNAASPPAEQRVILRGISWFTFERLLAERGNQGGSRVAYDGVVHEIMSPAREHERLVAALRRFVETLTLELGIGVCPTGSTTLARAEIERGAEPDASFYITHEPEVSLEFRGFPYEIAEHRPSRSLSSRHASRRARESSLLRTAFYFRRDRVDPRLDVGGTAKKSRAAFA